MIIGVDPSWACTAVRTDNGSVQCQTKPQNYPNDQERLLHISRFFSEQLEPFAGHEQKLAYVEGYAMAARNSRQQMIGELGGQLRLILYKAGWTIYLVPPTTIKQFACGKGNGKKNAMMMEVYKRWGYSPSDDNDADAYALWQLGTRHVASQSPMAVTTAIERHCFSKMEAIRPVR